jgi:pimeloyl-ACP methyl ester carboxylesterase
MKELYKLMPFEKETYLDTAELIRYMGYESETHYVTTQDGYILEMHRIPYGFGEKKVEGNKPRIPVLVPNFMMCCDSSAWVFNLRNQSMGYILADAGYDVWLGNFRGNEYSLNHTTLSSRSKKFWTYSFDELALYDMPAMMDYVIEQTGYDKIFLIASTLSSNAPLMLLSTHTEYNEKLKALVVFSPALDIPDWITVWGAARAFAKMAVPVVNVIVDRFVVDLIGHPVITRLYGPFLARWLVKMEPFTRWAWSVLNVGHGINHINITRAPLYAGHGPAPHSPIIYSHFYQVVAAGKTVHYDWGRQENLKRYGQEKPPTYDLTRITAPTFITYTEYDVFTGRVEAEHLAEKIKGSELYDVPDDDWMHVHYVFATNGKEKVFDQTIEFMNRHKDD